MKKMFCLAVFLILLLQVSAFCQTGPAPGWPPPSYVMDRQWQNIKDYGAKGDGTTDDRAAIQAALDAVGDSGGCVFVPHSDSGFLITNTIKIPSYVRLLGVGIGSVIRMHPDSSRCILANSDTTNGDTGIVVENIFFDGAKSYSLFSDRDSADCISLINVHQSVVRNCWITRTDADGIAFRYSTDCKVLNNTLWELGEDGITVAGLTSLRNIVSGNHVAGRDTSYEVGGLIPSGILCKSSELVVSGNVITEGGAAIDINNESGDTLRDITVTGNLFLNCWQTTVSIADGVRLVVAENTFYECASEGVYTWSADPVSHDINISNNTFYSQGGIAIRAASGDNYVISGNVIVASEATAIQVAGDHITVTGNRIDTVLSDYGIHLQSTRYSSVSGNVISKVDSRGIYSEGAASGGEYITISGNTIRLCDGPGIYLSACDFSTLSGNICVDNDSAGIWINGSYNNEVVGNICTSPADLQEYGVAISGSSKNYISNNQLGGNASDTAILSPADNWVYANREDTLSVSTFIDFVGRIIMENIDNTARIVIRGLDANLQLNATSGDGHIEFQQDTVSVWKIQLDSATQNLIFRAGAVNRLLVGNAGAVSFNEAYTFPIADGTAGYVLETNGSGALSWQPNDTTGVQAGTADSMGVDTTGDGTPDLWLYSVGARGAFSISEGANIELHVTGDTVEIAGPAGSGTSDSMQVDTSGTGVYAKIFSTLGYAFTFREGTGIDFTVAVDTLRVYATLGTGISSGEIYDGTILPADLFYGGSLTDEYILTYEATGTKFDFHSPSELALAQTLSDTGTFNGTTGFGLAGGKTGTALKVKGLTQGSNITIALTGDSALQITAAAYTGPWTSAGDTAHMIDADNDTLARFWDNDAGGVTWDIGADQTTLTVDGVVVSAHASRHEDAGADEVAVTAGMMNTGTGASSSTYWRGDNTWQTPAGGGGADSAGLDIGGGVYKWSTVKAWLLKFGYGLALTTPTDSGGVDTLSVKVDTAAVVADGEPLPVTGNAVYDWVTAQSYLTGNESITLSGDATGTGATEITVTVVDDLHDHIYSNIDPTTSANWAGRVSDETGTGVWVFGTQPTFTTDLECPLVIGGTGTTSDLSLKTTSGVGAAGADMHFLVGDNGATEAMTILNNGNVGIGTTPDVTLHLKADVAHGPFIKLDRTDGTWIDDVAIFGISGTASDVNTDFLWIGKSVNDKDFMLQFNTGNVGIGNGIGVILPPEKLSVLGNIATGDTATGVVDVYHYFSTNGSWTTEYLMWDDDPGVFVISDAFQVDGNILLSGTVDTVDVAALGATVPLITDDTANFKTAYGWGNHATQNYLDNDDANVDTAAWNADITGLWDTVGTRDTVVLVGSSDTFVTVKDGNVGIGITSPDEILHLFANNAALKLEDNSGNDATINVGNSQICIAVDPDNLIASSDICFDIDGDEVARFHQSTNFGIGTMSPPERVSVVGNIATGDTTTGDVDVFHYFSTNGSWITEYLKWDDGLGRFELSDDLDVTGTISVGGTDLDAKYINNDSIKDLYTQPISRVHFDTTDAGSLAVRYSDTAGYAAVTTIDQDAEFRGYTVFKGNVSYWNHINRLDYTNARAEHAADYLRLPQSYDSWSAADSNKCVDCDSSHQLHPAFVYAPEGLYAGAGDTMQYVSYRRQNRRLLGVGPICTASDEENPHFFVKSERYGWHEFFVGVESTWACSGIGQDSIPIGFSDSTANNPIYEKSDSLFFRGDAWSSGDSSWTLPSGLDHLSDQALFVNPNDTLFMPYRGSYVAGAPDTSFLALGRTGNGYQWSEAVVILSEGLCRDRGDTMPGATIDSIWEFMSPTIEPDTGGTYEMWTVEKNNDAVNDSTYIIKWEAPQADSGWRWVRGPGALGRCIYTPTIANREPWHMRVKRRGRDELWAFVAEQLIGGTGGSAYLTIAVSYDDGFTWQSSDTLLAAGNDDWNNNRVYYGDGAWVDEGKDSYFELYYTAYGANHGWATAQTELRFSTSDPDFAGTATFDSAQFDGNVDIDSMDVNGAADFTGTIDAGGATSLEIPNSTAPVPTSEGQLFQDSDDDMLEGTDGTNDFILGERFHSFLVSIDNPDGLTNDTILIPIRGQFPGGIIIDSVGILTDVSSTYKVVFLEWTNVNSGAGTETRFDSASTSATFEAAVGGVARTIEYNNLIALYIPATDIGRLTVWIRYEILGNN